MSTYGAIWAHSNLSQKTPCTYMYMGVGYNAIIDSALISISASPSVTPCHGHTKNRMQYYAIIYNTQVWVHNCMKAFDNWAREETTTILKSRGQKIIQLRLWGKIGQRYFCHLFPYSFHIIVCNVIWFSIIFLFEAGLSRGKSILKRAIMHQNSHFGGEAAF